MRCSITQKLVSEVKRFNKKNLHSQQWHNFMTRADVEAINMAIFRLKGERPSLSDIVKEAKKCFEICNN